MDLATGLAAFGSTVLSALASASDVFWQGKIFEKELWTRLMTGLRISLTLGGVLLLLYEIRARRMGEIISERAKRRIGIVFTALAFGAYFDFFNPNVRYDQYYHRHEYFHYYLGSKYSDALGYTRLYECTAVAEIELGRGAQVKAREIRDLRVNLIKQVADTIVVSNPDDCKKRFSPAHWEDFKKDVDWFYRMMAGSYWEGGQKDHGYNPPPVWTMTGKFFGSFGHADDKFFKILSSLDILFHIGTVLMLGWAFGWRVMTIATVFWGANSPANFYWTGGAFMRQDWLFFLVASVCLARKKHFALAGAALTWSALLRVFPVIVFAGPGLIIALQLVKHFKRRRDAASGDKRAKRLLGDWLLPEQRRFVGGCIVAAGVLIPASMVVAGPDSYVDFVKHTLTVHKNTPLTNHMGLETMLVHDWDGRMRFTRNDNLDDPFQEWKEGRTSRFAKPLTQAAFKGISLICLLWTAWALRRTKLLWVGMGLSMALEVCLTNLTCYYYSMFMIAAPLALARPAIGVVLLMTSGASQIIGAAGTGNRGFYWIDDNYAALSWLFFACSLLFLYAYSRPLNRERLLAWWNDQPEPKSEKQLAKRESPPSPAE
jgi:hypothetical protein